MPTRPERIIALSALAGAALVLAFAPFDFWWLAPVCYAVLFASWRNASPREAFVRGFAFGTGEFLLGVYWIWNSVHEIGQAPVWLAILLMLGLVAAMALYPAVAGYVAARWLGTEGRRHWLGTFPALFILFDWLRGWFLTGFGWLAPGYSQTESWLIGIAPLFGVHGVGWAVLLAAGAMLCIVCGRGARVSRERLAVPFVVLVAIFATGLVGSRLAWTEARGAGITVALAQGAVPQELKWDPAQLPGTLELYRDLTLEALGTDLIVWPEAAIPQLYENMRAYIAEIDALTARAESAIMLGMLRYHEGGAQNAVFVLGQDSVYVKRHLVPYGEYFPVPGIVRRWLQRMELPNIDTEPGNPGQPPIPLLGERIAVTICYEDVFGAEQLHSFPEATLLVNVSNDAWFGDSIAPHQHLQIARMRAAEVRRWQARATNTGITAIIDPFGRVTTMLPQFEPGVLRGTVRGMEGRTPYIVWGNLPVIVIALAIVAVSLLAVRRRRAGTVRIGPGDARRP